MPGGYQMVKKNNMKKNITKSVMSLMILSLMIASVFAQSANFIVNQNEDEKKIDLTQKVCDAYWKGYQYDNGQCVKKSTTACSNPFKYETKKECLKYNPPVNKFQEDFEAYVFPERNVAVINEKVTYTLVIKDYRPRILCVAEEGTNCDPVTNYELKFDSKTVKSNIDEGISLRPGEKKSIDFEVYSGKIGANQFTILIVDEFGSSSKLSGKLIVKKGIIKPPVGNVYFQGEGIALSDTGDNLKVSLNLIGKPNTKMFKGKGTFGDERLLIEGDVLSVNDVANDVAFGNSDSEIIRFDIINPEAIYEPNQIGDIFQGPLKVGQFSGNIFREDGYSRIEGVMDLYNQNYKLDISGRDLNHILDLVIVNPQNDRTSARINDLIVLQEIFESPIEGNGNVGSENDPINLESESYIKPIRVRQSRFLWIFPNPWGKKVLEVEHIDGLKITKKVIGEKSALKIGKYNIEVGSLEDETNLELIISRV